MAFTKVPVIVAKALSITHITLNRALRGRGANSFAGAPVVFVTTTGRKTGSERTTPLIAKSAESGWIVVASFSGHDRHPHWYLNMRARPGVTVRERGRDHEATARELHGPERQDAWDQMVEIYPAYGDYEAATAREIPVLCLETKETS